MHRSNPNVVVIGGGFYGCYLALLLRNFFKEVVIVEKEPELFIHASYVNQARVHNGYHYPRSFLTAYRSHLNYPEFVRDFRETVDESFEAVYAVARSNSKVTASQFKRFCEKVGAPIREADKSIKSLFNLDLIEGVFLVREGVFDAFKLRDLLKEKLRKARVKIFYQTEGFKLTQTKGDLLELRLKGGGILKSSYVFNCTYSQINTLLKNSNLPLLPFKQEITELVLIEAPKELREIGITVMDGPFFSVLPFPAKGVQCLSHVRYTPHLSWSDLDSFRDAHAYMRSLDLKSNYPFMVKDAQRYVPSLAKSKYVESLFTVKTVLLQSEVDDGRPILYKEDYGLKNFFVVMGGKVDNVYDIEAVVREALRGRVELPRRRF